MYDPHATSSTFSATVTQYGGYRQPLDGSPSLDGGFGPSQIVTAAKNAPIAALTDDFTTADTTKWTFGAASSVTGGQLIETCNSAYNGNCVSVNPYDLTGSAAVVELVQRANVGNGGTETYFQVFVNLANANDNAVLFDVVGANLIAYRRVGGVLTTVGSTAYSATAHRWLRILESGGTVFWDTSPDRTTWTNLTTWVPTWAVTSLYVMLGTGFQGTEPSPGTATWDNVNTVPASSTPATATGSITLDGSVTASASGAAAGTISLGGAATPAAAATSTGNISLGGTATSTAGASAPGSITLSGAATTSARVTAAGSIALAGSVTATAPAAAAGSVTLGGTGTAVASSLASGTITLGGASTATVRATVTGAITLSGTATGTQTGTSSATGAITLGGSAQATARPSALTGAIVLGGTATASVSATATGGITLGGSTAGQAVSGAAGLITLGGAVTAAVPATAAGIITLSGLANGTAGGAYRDITLTVSAGRSRGLTAAAGVSRTLAGTGRSRDTDITAEQSRHLSATGRSRTLTATPQE